MEIILVDQTETHEPSTEAFLRQHGSRIKRFFQSVPNLPLARNSGLNYASGSVVFFVDDDVLLPSDCIRRLTEPLMHGVVDVISGLISFDKTEEEVWDEYRRSDGFPREKPRSGILPVRKLIGALMGIRSEVLISLKGFDANLGRLSNTASGEDYEFCRRVVSKGFRLGIDPNVVIRHPLGITGGCQNRVLSSEITRKAHIQSFLYIEMKSTDKNGRISFSGWLRFLRGYVLNRELIRKGVRWNCSNLSLIRQIHRDVKSFYTKSKLENQ